MFQWCLDSVTGKRDELHIFLLFVIISAWHYHIFSILSHVITERASYSIFLMGGVGTFLNMSLELKREASLQEGVYWRNGVSYFLQNWLANELKQEFRTWGWKERQGHMAEGLATFRAAVRMRLNKLETEPMSYGVVIVS